MSSKKAKPEKKLAPSRVDPQPLSAKKSRNSGRGYPGVTVIGAGNWGTALALALHAAGVPVEEIVTREKRSASRAAVSRGRRIAATVGARVTTLASASLKSDVLWICTPDVAIRSVAGELARLLEKASRLEKAGRRNPPVVFHSSGALASDELAVLRTMGATVASVHPLMTFPKISTSRRDPRPHPLTSVPFAIEGDPRACRIARQLVRTLGGEAFVLPAESKAMYHAYGAFASPLLVALLTAGLETGVAAGFTPQQAKLRMRPIVESTVKNFFANGPKESFSGPIARGDTATIAQHLKALHLRPGLQAVYQQLTQFALGSLPVQNRHPIEKLLQRLYLIDSAK